MKWPSSLVAGAVISIAFAGPPLHYYNALGTSLFTYEEFMGLAYIAALIAWFVHGFTAD